MKARAARFGPAVLVFAAVLAAQLALVAAAGTDVPFQEQWDLEGGWLVPAWRSGTLHAADFFRAHNGHRIAWTHALNLALLAANGRWDPLVQLVAGAFLHALVAAGLAWQLLRGWGARWALAAGVIVAALPFIGWHNALWGFQSHVYFAAGFSLLAFMLLGGEQVPIRCAWAGIAAGVAALLAMGVGALVPVALLALAALRAAETRRGDWGRVWPALTLLGLAWLLAADVPELAALRAANTGEFFTALGRALAWPHTGQPLAAVALNVPLVLVVAGRALRLSPPAAGEDFVLLLGGWAAAVAVAVAWARGGSAEWAAGVPSRYADFLVLLPLANAWCAARLVSEATDKSRHFAYALGGAWGVFLVVGWLALAAQMWRGVIAPRARDREAPVRLVRQFQATGDAAVFAGQPRLLVPHPDAEAVRRVLADPRLRGVLPPSLQPNAPQGPLSRGVRALLGRQ